MTRIQRVAQHLKARRHISEGTSLIEYGRFRLSDVIYRLRHERQDLLPEGMEIITIHKHDTQGNPYGEYHLVHKGASAQAQAVRDARSAAHEAAAV